MRVKKNILFLSIFSIFVGCGGGSTSTTNVGTNEDNSSSEITLNVADELNKKFQFNQNGLFRLDNAPKGMAVYPDGTLTWKPTSDQDGDYAVTVNVLDTHGTVVESKKLDFHVRAKSISYDGLFVDMSANSGGDGTAQKPYGTFQEACSQLNGLHKIYLRGGVYYNPGYHSDGSKAGRYPAITGCVGTETKPIVITPWGNEYVKLKTDALYGLKIKDDAKYITVQNLEIEGEAQSITFDKALEYWWWDSNDTMQSSGISANGSYLTIKDCLVCDMPGSGISVTKGAYTTIENNIVYNSDWWTIAGSKGIGITQAVDDSSNPANGAFKNKIVGNLIFNVEQRLFSHVWGKGFATLSIDEGEAFLIQEGKQVSGSSATSYSGRYLIKDNVMLYNGKSGVINLAKNVTVSNNSYYNNGTATKQSGFRVNKSTDIVIEKNAVESNVANTIVYSVGGASSVDLTDNYVKGVVTTQNSNIDGITEISHDIFNDPSNFDFSIVASLQQDIGASKTARDSMREKLERFKIDITNQHQSHDESEQTKTIVETAPGKIDCSNYNDAKPYVRVYDIDSTHPIVADKGLSEFKLYIKHPYGTCVER